MFLFILQLVNVRVQSYDIRYTSFYQLIKIMQDVRLSYNMVIINTRVYATLASIMIASKRSKTFKLSTTLYGILYNFQNRLLHGIADYFAASFNFKIK
jgi:hypothetical protein